MTDGDLPKKAQELVEEWLDMYYKELQDMWDSQKLGSCHHCERRQTIMIPRIKSIQPQENFKLVVVFDSGEKIVYDVSEDIAQIPEFSVLKTEYGLFENLQLDESRTCVYWSDRVDLSSDTLFEYGKRVEL